jgi:hypothetical protein
MKKIIFLGTLLFLGIIILLMLFFYFVPDGYAMTFNADGSIASDNTGLIKLWHFEENTSTFALSSVSVDGQDTINIFGCSYVSGKFGYAIDNGGTSYARTTTQDDLGLNNLTAFALTWWEKRHSNTKDATRIWTTADANGNTGLFVFSSGNPPTSEMVYEVTHNCPWTSNVNFPVVSTMEVWVHFAYVFTSNNHILEYVNGVFVSSTACTATNPDYFNINERTLFFGCPACGSHNYANMAMDDLAVWNYALSETEINDIYTSYSPATDSAILFIYAKTSNLSLGGYDYGDIIAHCNDIETFGMDELDITKFFRIKITDMECSDSEAYLVPLSSNSWNYRRRYQILTSSMSEQDGLTLTTTGYLDTDTATFLNFIKDKSY